MRLAHRLMLGVAVAAIAAGAAFSQVTGGGFVTNQPVVDLTNTPNIGAYNQMVVGTSTANAQAVSGAVVPIFQVQGTSAATARMNVGRWSAAGLAANYNCTNSRGTAIGTHAVINALDPICQFVAMGDDGTNFQNSSSIIFSVDNGTVSSTSMPGKICLNTAPNSSVAPTAALCVDMAQDAYFTSKIRPASGSKVLLQGFTTSATQLAATQSTAPTCTQANNCGTGGGTVVGTDTAGIITLGTTPASGFILTFNGTWAAAPSCIVTAALAGMATGKKPLTVATTTGQFTVVTDGTAPSTSDKYAYICIGVS